MPPKNVFDDIGNVIGGIFHPIGEAINSGVNGLTRGFQPESHTAPIPIAPHRREWVASMKTDQSKQPSPPKTASKAYEVPHDGQWHATGNGWFTIRLGHISGTPHQNAAQAHKNKPVPKHRDIAKTKGKIRNGQVAAHKTDKHTL